jgi:RNA polymerase sigma-70 factor, ECF subfamily
MIATAPAPDFADLWHEYHSRIFAYIYRKTSDPTISEDLCSDVFLKALDSVKRGTEVEHLAGWLYRIAHNLVIDTYRARDCQSIVGLEASADIPHGETPHDTAMQAVNTEIMRRAMSRLTDEQAEILELYYLDGYSFGEIAAMMGKTKGAVKSMKLRAVKTLHLLLCGEDRPSREDGRQDAVAALLRERGPMTIREIMAAMNERKGVINYALHASGSPFVPVDTRPGITGDINVWGLRGIHDRRAA